MYSLAVRLEVDTREAGHGAGDARLGDEAEDAEHGEAAVVDLGAQPLGLLLGRGVLAEAERVEQVERQRVRPVLLVEEAAEGRVVAGLATLDVVLLAVGLDHGRELADGLEEAHRADDLHLGPRGERVPLVTRPARRRDARVRDTRGGERA